MTEPGVYRPADYHVELSDGVVTVGLNAVGSGVDPDLSTISRVPVDRNTLKTSQGNTKYSDLQPPFSAIAQDTWIGGRARPTYDSDTTAYSDGHGLTLDRANKAFLAGREKYATGLRTAARDLPGGMAYQALYAGAGARALSVSLVFAANIGYCHIWLKAIGNPQPLGYELRTADHTGILVSASIAQTDIYDSTVGELVGVNLNYSFPGTYRLCIVADASDDIDNHWLVGVDVDTATPTTKASSTASLLDADWTTTTGANLYYSVADDATQTDGAYFEYRGATYFVTKTPGSAGRLYINGERGAASYVSLDVLHDGTKAWATNQHAGKIVKIVGQGPGVEEDNNFRVVVSNTGTDLSVSPPWLVAHTIATEYVILGANEWTEITGHGITQPVTDVTVSNNNVIYFAQGTLANVRRMRQYNNAGTFTSEYADDGTNKAAKLALIHSATGWEIWKGDNVDGAGQVSVAKAPSVAWGTNLTFAAALPLAMNDDLITRLLPYVDANQAETLWIMTEGAPWYIQSGVPVRVPLKEYETVRNNKNGKAATVASVNLYFSMGVGVERYYGGNLDDVGPNLFDGLSALRTGRVSSLIAYPGRLFASIAGTYSSVMAYNGAGWHEIYRAPRGETIYAMIFQPVPGSNTDKLWIRQGADMVYIPFPSETFDPLQDTSYTYKDAGFVESGWITSGLLDAWKYFKSVKLFVELGTLETWVTAQYKIDDDSAWRDLPGQHASTVNTIIIPGGAKCKRIKLRVWLVSTAQTLTPVLKAYVVEGVIVTDPKWIFQFTSMVEGHATVQQLDTWAGTAQPLTLRCQIPLFDNIPVFLMAVPVTIGGIDRYPTQAGETFKYRMNVMLQEA